MQVNNQLSTQTRSTALATGDVAGMAQKLRYMIQNGAKLADQEVMALAQYSVANDLNPFAQECYYLPGKGPCPGIVGWRKKAQEQLDWESAQAHEPGAHFWVEYEPAGPDEAKFDASKGDVAWKAVLRDWLSSKRWRNAYFQTARDLREMGVPNPLEEAKHYVGPEPVWTGVGVVSGSENFGGDKLDRNERAKKRAEKVALRKRFPRVNLPEPEGVDVDVVDVQFVEAPRNGKSEGQLIGELTGSAPVVTGEIVDPEPEHEPAVPPLRYQPEQTQSAGAPALMSLETAGTITNRDGLRYIDIPSDKLSYMKKSLISALTKAIPEDGDELRLKIDAIKTILLARAAGDLQEPA